MLQTARAHEPVLPEPSKPGTWYVSGSAVSNKGLKTVLMRPLIAAIARLSPRAVCSRTAVLDPGKDTECSRVGCARRAGAAEAAPSAQSIIGAWRAIGS